MRLISMLCLLERVEYGVVVVVCVKENLIWEEG